jgi:epoxyqueuosine reductase
MDAENSRALADRIKAWGRELGFAAVRIADPRLPHAEAGLDAWLKGGCHGEMDYMAAHGMKRARPQELLPDTRAVIIARMDYRPDAADAEENLRDGSRAYISRYALGRDYHKLLRARLQKLAERIVAEVGPTACRVFVDSAPVMEVEAATRAGLGWRGKHTLLLARDAGSWFFLGEIFTDLPLPFDEPQTDHCGTCRACIDACPTGAITAPCRLDARRCISYLTIELKGSIPEALRPQIGNRIYGCDDCQLCCPWNRHAPLTRETDFAPRHGLDTATLIELFAWQKSDFAARLAGSAIHRIGHERWLRNIAVALGNALSALGNALSALGNAPTTPEVIAALAARRDDESALVREHVRWALAQCSHSVTERRFPGS